MPLALQMQFLYDLPDSLFHWRIIRKLYGGLSLTVVFKDRVVLGNDPQQLKPLLLNLFPGPIVQYAFGRPVDDQADGLRLHAAVPDELSDPPNSLHASSGTVTDQDRCLHAGQDPTADNYSGIWPAATAGDHSQNSNIPFPACVP